MKQHTLAEKLETTDCRRDTKARRVLNCAPETVAEITAEEIENGVSLERIRDVLSGGDEPLPPRRRQPGSIDVRSHILIAQGIELQLSPEEASLSPEQTRALIRAVLQAYQDIKEK